MSAAELKLEIFRKIDSLEETKLEELYGLMLNFINSKKELSDWDQLTKTQQEGIIAAIDEIGSGKGLPHNQVINKYKKKYPDA